MNISKREFKASSELIKAGKAVGIEPKPQETAHQFSNRLVEAVQENKTKRRRALAARVVVSAALAACGVTIF